VSEHIKKAEKGTKKEVPNEKESWNSWIDADRDRSHVTAGDSDGS
jgi:hypothetical protein